MAPSRRAGAKGPAGTRAGQQRQTPEQRQARAVYTALQAGDFTALEELAYAPHGFCSAELRRSVWLFLLGLTSQEAVDSRWRRLLPGVDHDGKEAKVMQADVQRSVYSWDVHTGIRKTARNQKRVQLSEVMHAILRRHSGKLSYFQGFHDIALVFLEVGTPSQAFHMAERLALFRLSDQLCCPFDQGLLPLLRAFFCLLELLDAPVAEALREADCAEAHFAVPWVLTWFAHSLPRLHQQVMRLYDCLLASHPAMILYFCAAVLLGHRDTLLATEREMPEMMCAVQSLPLGTLNADDWAAHAWRLAKRVSPEQLLEQLPPKCWQALPATSPLFHFPLPWMPSKPGAEAVAVAAAAAAEVAIGDGNAEPAGMSRMSPVYRGGQRPQQPVRQRGGIVAGSAGVALRREWRARVVALLSLLTGISSGGFLIRALSMGGFVAAAAWLLSPRAWAKL